jgi:hypothetical protein
MELDAIPDATTPFVGQADEIVNGKRVTVPVLCTSDIIDHDSVTDADGQRWLVGRNLGGMLVKRGAPMYEFTSNDAFEVPGRGIAYPVANPVLCNDFSHLIGQEVRINGETRKVICVERFMHMPPWWAGEEISLLVETRSPQ